MLLKNDICGKKISIIGAGKSGRASAALAASLGAAVFVSDVKEELPEETVKLFTEKDISYEKGGHSERSWDADLLVLSSGVSPSCAAVEGAIREGVPVIGELDFVYPFLKGRIIGITGSNGKTTTTSLLGHFLQASGYNVVVAGNIGNPVSLYAHMELDFLVLELSSFQLYWSTLLKVDLAVITNLAPDHIDWHGSYENYISSKAKLLCCCKPGAPAIIQQRDLGRLRRSGAYVDMIPLSWERADQLQKSIHIDGRKIFLNRDEGTICLADLNDIPLIGNHNIENAAMALSALELMGVDHPEVPVLFEGYIPPPHRCEFVAEIKGVRYIDDSKGTNVAASVTALNSISGKKIVILGGKGKGEDYTPLVESVQQNALEAIVLGDERRRIVSSLHNSGFLKVHEVSSMDEAVLLAHDLAVPGTTVLLSPACTSWDMYESYKKRGEHFQALVKELMEDV